MRRHHDRQQLRDADRTQARSRLEDARDAMAVGFLHHRGFRPGLQRLEGGELAPEQLDHLARCRRKRTRSLRPSLGFEHRFSRTRHAARTKEALEPALHSRDVPRHHRVGTRSIAQRRELLRVLEYRSIDLPGAQLLRQSVRVDRIALLPGLPLAAVHHELRHARREDLVEPLAPFAFLDAQVQISSELPQVADQRLPVRLDHVLARSPQPACGKSTLIDVDGRSSRGSVQGSCSPRFRRRRPTLPHRGGRTL